MRLIDADETRKNLGVYLKKIHNHSINTVSKYGREMFEVTEHAIQGCIDIVSLIPTASEWIPCSERLPENQSAVMITCDGLIFDSRVVALALYNDKTFFTYDGQKIGKVYAWQALPKPYEVEK